MTWLSDLEYDSDASSASIDDRRSDVTWRGASSPLCGDGWLRDLETSLRNDIGTKQKEDDFCTNSKEEEDRVYMGIKHDWICQRCQKRVNKPAPTMDAPEGCPWCKANEYLGGLSGVVVSKTRDAELKWRAKGKKAGDRASINARIFHTESKGTQFWIDLTRGTMRVDIIPNPKMGDLPTGIQTYKLMDRSVSLLKEKIGERGLVGRVAENVVRERPDEVVVTPAGDLSRVLTIVNPAFGALKPTDPTPVVDIDNIPLLPDPENIGEANDLPRPSNKRTRVEVPVEPDATELFDAELEASPPPATRRRTALDVTAYIDDESSVPSTFTDVESLDMLILHLNVSHDRMGDDGDDVVIVLPSREELTQQIWDSAVASDKGTLEILVYSKSATSDDDEPAPSTQLRNIEGMMGFGNPLMSDFFQQEDVGMTAPQEEEEEEEGDRLVEEDEDEEDEEEDNVLVDEKYSDKEEEETEDLWDGRTALDADSDARMNTPFPMPGGGHMTLAQYLEENPDLLPWADFISPHRLTMLDDVPHPFLVLSALFFDGAVAEAQRFLNMHNNAKKLADIGLGDAFVDPRFLNGFRWDVSMIANAAAMKRERERKDAEKRAVKERKAAEQEAERERKRKEKEEAGRVRDAAKKADAARRRALAEENRRVQAELREEEKRRRMEEKTMQKQDRAAMRELEKLMKPGLKQMETNEERQAYRTEAQERYSKLPWARTSVPDGVARHPETGNPIVFTDVPEIIRKTLFWLMAYRLYLHLNDPLTGEMIFRNISRYYGNPPGGNARTKTRDFSRRQWRSWQLQRKIPGTSGFLGQYIESIVAALVNAASIVDPRINTSDSALSWLIWILDSQNADRWLRDPVVVQGLQEQEHHPVGRTMSRAQDKYDAEFRQQHPTYVPPVPTTLDIPNAEFPPPPPPPPFGADPTLPLPPLHPVAPSSDAGTSSDVAGSSTDVLPMPELPPPAPPNVNDASALYDLFNEMNPDESTSLGDMVQLLESVDGNVERAADHIVNDDATSRMDKIRNYVRLAGATPDTARYLRDDGVTAAEILGLGLFDLSNLIDVFTVDSLVLAGASPYDLLDLGASGDALRDHLPRHVLESYGYDVGPL